MSSKSLIPQLFLAFSLSLFGSAAQAVLVDFQTTLSHEIEVPPPTIPEGFDPYGSAFGQLDTDTNRLTLQVDWTGLTTPVVGAHIHNGVPTGGILIGFPEFPTSQSGTYSRTFDLTDEQEATFLTGFEARTLYLNIHTQLNPPGEIRGFLAPIPEPETYGLMMTGLVGAWLAARRKRSSV